MDQQSEDAKKLVAHVNAFRIAVVRGVEAMKIVRQAISTVRTQLDLQLEFEPDTSPVLRDYLLLGVAGAVEGGVGGAVFGALIGSIFGDAKSGALLGAGLGAALGGAAGVNKVQVGWRVGIRSGIDGQRDIIVERVR